MMADPTRARMLARLLSGESRTAGELAQAAGITPQAATSQLAQLQDAGLICLRAQGRHKYFALADADVAHALQALAMVAERDGVQARWQRPAYQPLKHARRCYGHLAGELGVAQFNMLLARGYLHESDSGLRLTEAGRQWLDGLGVPVPPPRGRLAYRCMDWSERQDHLAGPLAKALLNHYLHAGWLRAGPESRALLATPAGLARLLPMIEG
ncbi:winged helix-turn-helix transcriptional regulator [Ottowia testudinis]|uniref:Winged helix-turn-helix transcriptional regulator n=2 Tax=Ottowia testudinis TaxID=2816950 RepID=A0A975CJH0_9BURK|nr:winged helix-turn-helix transcriptional regulator [Ottowia testudinis]